MYGREGRIRFARCFRLLLIYYVNNKRLVVVGMLLLLFFFILAYRTRHVDRISHFENAIILRTK